MKTFFALCLVLVLVLAIALPTAVLASGITAGVSGDVPPVPVLTISRRLMARHMPPALARQLIFRKL